LGYWNYVPVLGTNGRPIVSPRRRVGVVKGGNFKMKKDQQNRRLFRNGSLATHLTFSSLTEGGGGKKSSNTLVKKQERILGGDGVRVDKPVMVSGRKKL